MLETALESALSKDEFTKKINGGIVARDELPDKVSYPSCYIINTRQRTHSGEHWLAVFYDNKGQADFFDSYGHHPSYFNLTEFLDHHHVHITIKEFRDSQRIAATIVFFICFFVQE